MKGLCNKRCRIHSASPRIAYLIFSPYLPNTVLHVIKITTVQKIIIVLLFSLTCFSCQSDKEVESETAKVEFDKDKWATNVAGVYPYRPEMLDEVLYSDHIRTLKWNEVLEMLGDPDREDENYLFYMIEQRKIGFFTLNQRTLVIKMEPDSTVNWIKLHE